MPIIIKYHGNPALGGIAFSRASGYIQIMKTIATNSVISSFAVRPALRALDCAGQLSLIDLLLPSGGRLRQARS